MNNDTAMFVCEQNIVRYEKILRTALTDRERDFISARLAEEKRHLESARAQTQTRVGGTILGNAYPIAKVIAIACLSDAFELLAPSFNLVERVVLA